MRALKDADVVAHFAKAGNASNARAIVASHLKPGVTELPLHLSGDHRDSQAAPAAYCSTLGEFYDGAASAVAAHLDAGRTVAVLCEGDPLFYGSYMHLHARLGARYPTEVIPGVTGMSGCWSAVGAPIAQGDDVFTVLPGTLPETELARRLARHRRCRGDEARPPPAEGAPRARRAPAGSTARSMSSAAPWPTRWSMPLADKPDDDAPYFAIVLVPGWEATAVSGRLAVVGLGPGRARWLTPRGGGRARRSRRALRLRPLSRSRSARGRARRAMHRTTARSMRAPRPRSRHAAEGAHVALVSGGDPGVFAMAAAVCEAIETGPEPGAALDVAIVPGVTAMLAVAARVGAPLGHDFCALSLSDNLKPWEVIERRLDAAAAAGFVIALYNPISRARPWQLGAALRLPAAAAAGIDTPVVFGRAVGRADERVTVTTLAAADAIAADMATLRHRRLAARRA